MISLVDCAIATARFTGHAPHDRINVSNASIILWSNKSADRAAMSSRTRG
jgi:hypothetical protein